MLWGDTGCLDACEVRQLTLISFQSAGVDSPPLGACFSQSLLIHRPLAAGYFIVSCPDSDDNFTFLYRSTMILA